MSQQSKFGVGHRAGFEAGKQCITLLSVAAVICILMAACNRPPPEPPLPVRIAIPMQPSSALMIVAWQQGYFEDEGLAPEYLFYPSGKIALEEALLPGLADVASSSDLPVAHQLLQGADITILATIQTIRSVNAIVARRDHNITGFKDLIDKRIGVQPLSAVHYFLRRVLDAHDMDPHRIAEAELPIQDLVPALLAGTVDAISIREPFLSQARDQLGDHAVVLKAP